MNVKEFRIGNCIQIEDVYLNAFPNLLKRGIIRIVGLGGSIRVEDNLGKDTSVVSECIKPVPITKEILLKCGFRAVAFYENVYEKDSVRIHTDTTKKTNTALFVMHYDNDTILKKEVSSLHQFQNLYFALIGKELDIDLSNI